MLKLLNLEAKINRFARNNQQISEELGSYFEFTTSLAGKLNEITVDLAQVRTRPLIEQTGPNQAEMDQCKAEIAANAFEIAGVKAELVGVKAEVAGLRAEVALVKSSFEDMFREFKVETGVQLDEMKAAFEKGIAGLTIIDFY